MHLSNEMVLNLRGEFPALSRQANGRDAVFLDGPAGTQVPASVIGAIAEYLTTCNANSHGAFDTSADSDEQLDAAHQGEARRAGAGPVRPRKEGRA